MTKQNRPDAARELVRAALPEGCRDVAGNWIAGAWSAEGDTFDSIDPTTGERLHAVAEATAGEVRRAANAAAGAATGWWAMDGQARAETFWRIADGIRARRRDLGTLDTLDSGRPVRDTVPRDTERAARIFEFFAGVTDRIRGATVPVQPGLRNATVMEPHGVVGAITPWNYPLINAATKLAPALATGNAVVLKPAEDTPLSALLLAEILQKAGLPDGVLNIVNGRGETVGDAVVRDSEVGKIAFTGSTEIGRRISGVAGGLLKPVTLELGGKSACIVFEDADLDAAASAVVFSMMMNQGQTCTAATRLVVARSVAGRLSERIAAAARAVRVGDPLDETTLVGPLVSRRQLERVSGYLELGESEGASGRALDVDWAAEGLSGFFPRPVVFSGVTAEMRINREEIFGPILVVMTFDDEDEAVALANSTDYGLASSVWTNDLRRADRLSERIDSGLVWINTVHSLHPGSPFGGFRQSGVGLEMGLEAIHQFMRVKSVWRAVEPYRSPWPTQSAA